MTPIPNKYVLISKKISLDLKCAPAPLCMADKRHLLRCRFSSAVFGVVLTAVLLEVCQ